MKVHEYIFAVLVALYVAWIIRAIYLGMKHE